MNVIGLDLSLTAPGMAADRMLGAVRCETLHTDVKRGDKRYCDIRDWLRFYLAEMPYALAVIEAVPPYDHASSGLERVHGVAREILARHDVPFAYVNVTALKSFATGSGSADKADVMAYVESETGKPPVDSDQADAWVLRRMGQIFLGRPRPDALTPAQAKAIDSVEWPLFPDDPSWPAPYGAISARKPVIKKCGHGIVCLKNGDHWLHPFNVVVCDKPPKTTAIR